MKPKGPKDPEAFARRKAEIRANIEAQVRAPVGRPPFPSPELPEAYLAKLDAQARDLANNPGKLKKWLKQRRMFHVLLQDHLSTAPLPGASGVQLNAASSKLFLEMTEDMAAALKGVEEEA